MRSGDGGTKKRGQSSGGPCGGQGAEKSAAKLAVRGHGASGSFWIGGVGLGDANPVVGKGRVEGRELDFWHVARDAVFCGDGATCAGTHGGALLGGGGDVAGEAVGIIGSRIVNERFVRIVAGNASDASVALGPTATVFEAVRGKADVESVSGIQMGRDDVLPSAMAGTAKVDGIDAGQIRGIENEAGTEFLGLGGSRGDMLRTGAVAGFAIHTEHRFGGIELIAHDGGSGVAGEARARFFDRHCAASGRQKSGRPKGRGARSDVEGLQSGEEAEAAFVKGVA